eukprot:6456970-Amphidinium_carterae.1
MKANEAKVADGVLEGAIDEDQIDQLHGRGRWPTLGASPNGLVCGKDKGPAPSSEKYMSS